MKPRYRFAEFTVSPSLRILSRAGREVPLIPRYFDLLVLLLERRNQAVHRRDILEAVWNDVVVSDGALSQAVRTLRRALDDTAREPLFIRTVSRHGYRFVHAGVTEEPDAAPAAASGAQPWSGVRVSNAGSSAVASEDTFESALGQLLVGDSPAFRRRNDAQARLPLPRPRRLDLFLHPLWRGAGA